MKVSIPKYYNKGLLTKLIKRLPADSSLALLLSKTFPSRKEKIVIENHDVWSMDVTLSKIIVPMLEKLKEQKHGCPSIDNEDVPEEIRSTKKEMFNYFTRGINTDEGDTLFAARWDWVLEEMIWAHKQIAKETETQFFENGKFDIKGLEAHDQRIANGLRLFGKYYRALWD